MALAQKRLPADVRRKQILSQAVSVFAGSNYKTARVKEIADRIGISEAAIYNHFPSKKAIFLEILDHIQTRVLAKWQDEVDDDADALETLRQMGIAYVTRLKEHPDELKVQFQAISEVGDPDIAKRLRQDHRNYISFIDGIVRRGIERNQIKKNVDTRAFAFIFDGMGVLANVMNLLSEEEFNENQVGKMVDLLFAPLRP